MKRVVERVADAADAGDAPADAMKADDTPPVVSKSVQRRLKAQGLTDPHGEKAAESRPYVPPSDDNAHAQGRESLREIIARVEGPKAKGKPKAEKPAEVEPTQEMLDAIEKEAEEPEVAPEDDNDDPDAHPPGEEAEEEADGETEAPAAAKPKADGETFEYLTPAQRAELNAKMSEKRRERELEAELKRLRAC